MIEDPILYERVWGERPPEQQPVPPAELIFDDPEDEEPDLPPPPDDPGPGPDAPLRWPQPRPAGFKTAGPAQTEPPATEQADPATRQEPAASASTLHSAPAPYPAGDAGQLEDRLFRALEGLENRVAQNQLSNLAAQGEARILRAVEMLETRLLQANPGTAIPDLMVLGRLDHVEAKISNDLHDLERRLEAGRLNGDIDLKLKAEVSEKLRVVAEHLNDRLGALQAELHQKLDDYQSQTLDRLARLEAALQYQSRPEASNLDFPMRTER